MIERCLGARRARQIHRALRHFKVTILCLVMTIVVLRGTIGAGKFGTPEQDFVEIRDHFSPRKRAEPHRVLEEVQTTSSSSSELNNYATFDLNKLLVDEEDDSEKPDPKKPYSLGPKISDWMSRDRNGLNRTLIFQISLDPINLGLHGIEIFYNMALLDAEMAGFWAKLPLIRKLLLSHPEVEFLWWMDSDAMFTDMAFELPWERGHWTFLMHGPPWGQKGKLGLKPGKILTRELKDRPVFEADDQSAMVYLLATQKDTYEEMIENYHPGLGDHRWPLVTHFVGCKPCGKFGDYPVERCLKQMDRAFNFGDNQVLQIYGFTHKSLGSRRVKRTRNDTNNPLEVKDELGLLHPAFKAVKVSSS
ncbi:Xyloglucan 6-xylosyltransferase 2 [Vitis vinifera]|uniref:Xyloglucan 6-xylosyltransferase 2 n=1 Tax=Vitis vinifera TaxID=29760 RepID=A0A438F3K4_VITVI|nr:Xyloglucan 6-xylosyltransferase 2 [Vitis vinifera]